MHKKTYKLITHPIAFVFWSILIGVVVFLVFNYEIRFQKGNPNIASYSYIADYLNVILGSAVALAGALVAITIAHRTERVSDAQGRIENQRYLDEQLKNASSLFSGLSFRLLELVFALGNSAKDKDEKKEYRDNLLNCISKIIDGLESIAANHFAWRIWEEKSIRIGKEGKILTRYLENHVGSEPKNLHDIEKIKFTLLDLIAFSMNLKNYLLTNTGASGKQYIKGINDSLSDELKLFLATSYKLYSLNIHEEDSKGEKYRNNELNLGAAFIIDLFAIIPNGNDILQSMKSLEGRVEDDDLRNFLSIFESSSYIPSNLKSIMEEISEEKDILVRYGDWKKRSQSLKTIPGTAPIYGC